jgi:hypothetical protein
VLIVMVGMTISQQMHDTVPVFKTINLFFIGE